MDFNAESSNVVGSKASFNRESSSGRRRAKPPQHHAIVPHGGRDERNSVSSPLIHASQAPMLEALICTWFRPLALATQHAESTLPKTSATDFSLSPRVAKPILTTNPKVRPSYPNRKALNVSRRTFAMMGAAESSIAIRPPAFFNRVASTC